MDLSKPWITHTAVGVAAFAAGMGFSYYLNKRKKASRHLYLVEDEPERQMTIYEVREAEGEEIVRREAYIDGEDETPDETPDEWKDLVITDPIQLTKPAIIIGNVEREEEMTGPSTDENGILNETYADGWNYSEEEKKRSEDYPYVIHRDEFFNDERGFDQITLMYYVGDDIMTDEDDSPIPKYKDSVGELKFGYGSGDPNVFYARNPKRKAEYEVLRNPDSYASEILGLHYEPDEEEHPNIQHGVRKFRPSD